MRTPVVGSIQTRDGTKPKDGKLFNALAEMKKDGTSRAVVRPALNHIAETTGAGNGLVCFNGTLLSVFDAELVAAEEATSDYTHIICAESNTTIWRASEYVGTTIVGNGGSLNGEIYKSDDAGQTTSYVGDVPNHMGGDMWPDLPYGLINKSGQLYLLSTYSIYDRVYKDNSDYGATWTYVGTPAVFYPCCVADGVIYGSTLSEVLDIDDEPIGFALTVYSTGDLTSVNSQTTTKEIIGDLASINGDCTTVIGGTIHCLVIGNSLGLLYHFQYSGGSWSYTTQSISASEYISTKRCYVIDGKIYFITTSSVTGYVTLRAINYTTDSLEVISALGAVSAGANSRQLISNGTTLSVCLQFSQSMEYHHFENLGGGYSITEIEPLDTNAKYDFAFIP